MERDDAQAAPDRGDSSVGLRPDRPRHRHWRSLTVAVAAALVLATGATSLTVVLTRPRPAGAAPCAAPAPGGAVAAPSRLGSWPYHLLEPGSFGAVVASAPRGAVALQACGAQETGLRVIRLSLDATANRPLDGRIVATSVLQHGALLTSSVVVSGGAVWLGLARLDLAGSSDTPPYQLTLERFDASSLHETWSRSLGRGELVELAALPSGEVVASTGSALDMVTPRGSSGAVVRRLATLGGVAQHLTLSAAGHEALVGLIQPGKVGSSAAPRLEAIDVRSGAVVATRLLPAGSDPESIAVAGRTAWVALGDGATTTVVSFSLPGLSPSAVGAGHGVPATLESLTLSESGGLLEVTGVGLLACVDATTGAVLAMTSPGGTPPPAPSEMVGSGGGTVLAVTAAGLGLLAIPAACRA